MNAEHRNRIEKLFGEYVSAIDENRLEDWPALFTEQCRYIVTNRENYQAGMLHGAIYANTNGMLQDRVSALRDANIYESQHYRHIVGSTQILSADSEVARVKSNFLVIRIMHDGDAVIFATGSYLDKIDISEPTARFIERLVVCDSQKIDTLLAIPI
ncbi:aromatic-ring-hydroxylating dioxygenase subunit beta [Chromohalobacter israelensis]|uniref:aromatic-ring-hydroxylating dioxygenase subunit beta n=1 Tax=Chromohalobacter israelensis TaxID=141390 RepID=UPI001CC37A5A|nr:aromatic-ring-hydroxylating dioxygenase subunit beta [Chromohalobacter salexigens]MBZ5876245.1 nuclear transport factor 2 family protein [Chromohalobacter salexigens]